MSGNTPGHWAVTIQERGRDGTVVYRDAHGSIPCSWEFCGGEAVAAVSVGTLAEWQAKHPWAVPRRADIVARIGSEVIRQRAPTCLFEMDESNGWMTLYPASSGRGSRPVVSPPPPIPLPGALGSMVASSASFVTDLSDVRSKFAVVGFIVVMLVGVAIWVGGKMLSVRTIGSPNGDSVRVGNTVATMMSRLVPYVPSLHRDASKDRHSLGILLHAADGSAAPRYIEIAESVTSQDAVKSRITGADAQRIWFIAPEPGAIDLKSGRVLTASEFAAVQGLEPTSRGSLAELATGEHALEWLLASGGAISSTRFILSMSREDAGKHVEVGDKARPAIDLVRTRESATLCLGEVVTEDGQGKITTLTEQPAPESYFTSFLRGSRGGPLLVVPATAGGSASVLRLYEKVRYPRGTVFLSRVDESGATIWETDLGIERLEESLPDPTRPAFIGKLPAPPNKPGEPVLVVVDAATGKVTRHSLLMK